MGGESSAPLMHSSRESDDVTKRSGIAESELGQPEVHGTLPVQRDLLEEGPEVVVRSDVGLPAKLHPQSVVLTGRDLDRQVAVRDVQGPSRPRNSVACVFRIACRSGPTTSAPWEHRPIPAAAEASSSG